MLVRRATDADSPGVLEIVNREIREGVAHFAIREHQAEDVLGWVEAGHRHPFFVAIDDSGPVLGYARSSRWKDREAYDWACEIGIYVRPASQGQGVGKALYRSFLPEVIALGYRAVIAGIALPNPPSVRLHEAFGMRHIGTFPGVGYKHGRWIDVGYWVLTVEGAEPTPIARTVEE